jgi:hypothetical protein
VIRIRGFAWEARKGYLSRPRFPDIPEVSDIRFAMFSAVGFCLEWG